MDPSANRRPMARALTSVLLILALCGCAAPPEVEVLSPTRGDIQRSFSEQAKTRLAHTFTVRMPVTGRLSRIRLEPGDPIRQGETLATVDRVPLEAQVAQSAAQVEEIQAQVGLQRDVAVEQAQRDQARARWEAETENVRAMEAQVRLAEASLAQAEREARRQDELFQKGFVAAQKSEEARLEALSARQRLAEVRRRLEAQRAAVEAARSQVAAASGAVERRREGATVLKPQLEGARARLQEASHEAAQAVVVAPVTGLLLQRYEQGPGVFQAGTKLLEVGRLADLEAMAEVLTEDALTLKEGTPVVLAAGGRSLAGKVKRIDPAGFTKQSSLGVDQQRVEVIVAMDDPPSDLGVAFQLQATFVTEKKAEVLLIPRFSVLQAPDGTYFVYRVEQDTLQRQPVKIGVMGELKLEVLDGLSEGDRVVAVPDSTLKEGAKVTPVAAAGTES